MREFLTGTAAAIALILMAAATAEFNTSPRANDRVQWEATE